MTLSLNIRNFFNDSSDDALVDELRKRTFDREILEFEKKFNSKNERSLHVHICRLLKNRQISIAIFPRILNIIK